MNSTESAPTTSAPALNAAVFSSVIGEPPRPEGQATQPAIKATPRHSGYGMPCTKCKTYYAADLSACPVCQCPDRVSPIAVFADAAVPVAAATPLVEELPDEAALEEERERFLREFKSQSFADSMQINATSSFRCSREENHQGALEPATVCQYCYDTVRGRADLAEAALLIDVNEATQIIYDAVWSDPSNPGKTYQNAAHAILNELRRRAGISTVVGPLQRLTD